MIELTAETRYDVKIVVNSQTGREERIPYRVPSTVIDHGPQSGMVRLADSGMGFKHGEGNSSTLSHAQTS